MQKMTYSKALETVIATLDHGEVKTKLEALKASISKKNSADRKPTATQKANEGYKTAILNGMEAGKAYTITELTKAIPEIAELTNQRVSAIVRQMVEAGTVLRSEVKRKAYFTKAEAEVEDEGEGG